MSLNEALEDYEKDVNLWLDAAKKQVAAIARLQKAVASGNVRDLEKMRQSAQSATEVATTRAQGCEPFEFDVAGYLKDGYLDELKAAAAKADVRLYERDGVIFCYPALVRLEPELGAVRIDKKLEPNIRPQVLAAALKKAQSGEAKAQPARFIESLLDAYLLLRAKRKQEAYIDLPLTEIYGVFTILPGLSKEYTLQDFTRDIYLLDVNGTVETKSGWRLSLPASTVSRERGVKVLPFVTRDGHEKQYAAVRFTPAHD
ncbi:hypothetical protein IAD21_06308 [Abditibacteriota bacterium]|nr:hypothetical protein IAD21_06308 [Abditibacteriota bacterium]